MSRKDEMKKWRRKLNLTQKEWAKAIGVHPMTVSKWERGLAEPHPLIYRAAAEVVANAG